MTVYVEEFLYRGRDPEHEKNQEATFHVVLAQFVEGPDGKRQQLKAGPLTPEQAVEKGFSLPRILDEITASALLERDAAKARAEKAETERDVAKAEWTEMAKQANDAVEAKVAAERIAGQLATTIETERQEKSAILAQLDAALAPKVIEGPSNPLLNKLTFGLAGK